jgi:3-deoxy-D-manno-octulosonic-acid transferase
MWKIAYNLCFLIALPFLGIIAIFNSKLRKNLWERLFPKPLNQNISGGLWIHAASLGEAVIAENLLKYLKSHGTDIPFVISTNTHYTRDLLKKRLGNTLEIRSAPLDLSFSVHRFIGLRKPAALVIVETELWPNLIWIAKKRDIPTIIINGRISDSTIGQYRRLSFFLKRVLKSIDLVLAQSEEHGERFKLLGVEPSRVVTTGNLKYYREITEIPTDLTIRKAISFGSIREKELPIIMPVIEAIIQQHSDISIFIAPRELHLISAIEQIMPASIKTCRYSHLKDSSQDEFQVIVVDTVGDLLDIYSKSKAAFVGGSLAPYGGQNILEPLFVGTPVIFGPHVNNFRSAADQIIDQKAGILVRDGESLNSAIQSLLADEQLQKDMVVAGKHILDLQRGAMKASADLILEKVWKNSHD